jgi:hypothetical protein
MKTFTIELNSTELELLEKLTSAAANERRGYEHDIAAELGYESAEFFSVFDKVAAAYTNSCIYQKLLASAK